MDRITDPAVAIHLGSASLALLLGAWQLLAAKRGLRHRGVGYLWMGAMLAAALSSFWLTSDIGFAVLAGYGPLHALSLLTIVSIAMAVRRALQRDFRGHRYWVGGAYAGLAVAGVFAAPLPGRTLNAILFVDLPQRLLALAPAAF